MSHKRFLSVREFTKVVKNTPLISIDLCIINNGKILLGKRLNSPAKNYFFVPGGRIYKDEKIQEALKRILKEEIGDFFSYKYKEFLGVYEHMYIDNFLGNKDFKTHYIVLGYMLFCDFDSQILIDKIKSQHSEYIWHQQSKQNKQKLNIHKYTIDYLNNPIIADQLK